jgi:DNA invertase Pin-like site-specific DNA recombinase
VIAKLDRLARNVAFISMLLESGLDIACCDIPQADRFTMHILAAVAEREGAMISERTSAALQALKERGVPLGSARPGHWDGVVKEGPHAGTPRLERRAAGLAKAQARSRTSVAEEMSKHYEPIVPWIRDMRKSGMTLKAIIAALNAKGCVTRRGKPWNMATLRRVIGKYLGPDYLGQLNSVLRPVAACGG